MLKVQEHLLRQLGFWDALTIGVGTMIGAGIFLLSGMAVALTGPAAIFSYLGAGVVCVITAASAAELATGMPTSGGDYYFVSRSLGPVFGAVSGVSIWLSLTFAIAFYLFGLGEYLAQFLPVTPFWGAFVGGLLLIALNVRGARESGRTQVVVVLMLLVILGVFSVAGAFNMKAENFTPFFPFGTAPIASTTALVFVSFLGFVKIAAVAEEIKEPSKNLPRTLIGSVILVTLLYVLIVLVIAGIFSQGTIGQVRDPLTVAAWAILGGFGGGAIIFAGLLATLSSANASIMAASRINLAMARDRMIPNWLSAIHPRRLTPHRAILFTGALALVLLLIESLETLAKTASVLQLYSYTALNVGCMFLRAANPVWYRPSYRTPGYPFLQLFAATACIGIILYSGFFAQAALAALILFSLTWYAFWGRGRVEIEHAQTSFKANWADQRWRVFFQPTIRYAAEVEETTPARQVVETHLPRRVLVALANPAHGADLLRLGRYIATGEAEGGNVLGLHLVRVPLQTPLTVARDRFARKQLSIERVLSRLVNEALVDVREDGDPVRSIEKTPIEAVTDVAHDVFGGLVSETTGRRADLLLMGWRGGFTVGGIHESPVKRIVMDTQADLAILKNRGLTMIQSILVPWGGGRHAHLGLEIAVRIARATGASVHLLRVVRPDVDTTQERLALVKAVGYIVEDYNPVLYNVQRAESVTQGVRVCLEAGAHDLIIIGASHEWAIRRALFGTIPDVIADQAYCSVLMVRRFLPDDWSVKATEGFKRFKVALGLTTSPEKGNTQRRTHSERRSPAP